MVAMTGVDLSAIPHDAARTGRVTAAREVVPDRVVNDFVRGMFWTDPLVDAVVEDFAHVERGRVWRLLNRALESTSPSVPGAPASLEALLEPVMQPPGWFDVEQVQWGAAVWWRFWIANQIGLAGALRTGYRYGDLNKPQAMNGRSEKMAARRYEETARWVLAATEPGALVPGGAGFVSTIKIRLVHAIIRRRLRLDPQWNRAAWGEPIHCSGMAVTNNAFLLLPLNTLELVGVQLSDDEKDAVRALWHWIGYLMGVPDPMLPTNLVAAQQLLAAASIIFAPPDEDTRVLDAAIMSAGIRAERALPKPLRPITAPILRPAVSRVIWGMSNTIMNEIEQNANHLERVRHPVLAALRPLVALRERRRLAGTLGNDFDIATRQRRWVVGALSMINAAPESMQPHDAAIASA